MRRMDCFGDSMFVNNKRDFVVDVKLDNNVLDSCFKFSYGMTFGDIGQHRNYRSGGCARRRKGEIFINTFQGKIAECAIYQYFASRGYNITLPDFQLMKLGSWDSCDFTINNKKVAVKSTKKIGNLLLLETKDWDECGRYIPNINTNDCYYDYFILTRVNIDGVSLMKHNKILYCDVLPQQINLYDIIMQQYWCINIAGYINHNEFVNDVIKGGLVIPKNCRLNKYTIMDAENYYVQAGDMHYITELCVELSRRQIWQKR